MNRAAFTSVVFTTNLWSPILIGRSLVAWWDAAYTRSITLATGVSAWAARAGGITLTQATGASQPTYSNTARNGLPGISSDGAKSMATTVSSLPSGTNSSSSMTLGYVSDVSATRSIWSYGTTTTAQARGIGQTSGVVIAIYRTNDFAGSAAWNATDDIVYSSVAAGASPNVSIITNGSVFDSGTIATLSTPASSTFRLFTSTSGGSPWIGTVQEFFIISNQLDDFSRQKSEGYLAWKWKLTDKLPAGHPYKNAPPRASLDECERWADERRWETLTFGNDLARAKRLYVPSRKLITPDRGWRMAA